MKLNEIRARSKWDFKWDDDRVGFYVTKDGVEIPDAFYKANSIFDRSSAQSSAKQHMIKLRTQEWNTQKDVDYKTNQYEKPLTDIEKSFIELDKQLIDAVKNKTKMNPNDLERYTLYGQYVRKSILDHTHPAMSYRVQTNP